jgi:hypothetical protein
MRSKLLVKNPLWVANNQRNFVVNFHQDIVASMYSDSFQGQTDGGLFYWPNHSGGNFSVWTRRRRIAQCGSATFSPWCLLMHDIICMGITIDIYVI